MTETAVLPQVPLSVFIQSKGLSFVHQAVLRAHLWERDEGPVTHATEAEWQRIYQTALTKLTP